MPDPEQTTQTGETGQPAGAGTPPAIASGDPDTQPRYTKADMEKAIQERLQQWERSQDAKAKRAADEAEAKKLAEQQQFQELAAKHEKRAAELDAELRARDERLAALTLSHAVEREAAALGFADPADAHRFLDVAAVQRADDGTPQNVKALLTAVLDAKPYLKGQAANGTAGVPATPRAAGAPSHAELVAQTKDELRQSGRYAF